MQVLISSRSTPNDSASEPHKGERNMDESPSAHAAPDAAGLFDLLCAVYADIALAC